MTPPFSIAHYRINAKLGQTAIKVLRYSLVAARPPGPRRSYVAA
jgi:hypothetical protein